MSSPISAPYAPARRHRAVLATVLLAVVAALLVSAPTPAHADRYTPKAGVTFNYPLGKPAGRQAILRKVLDTVGGAPPGSTIRFASWNIRGYNVVNALLAAHRRGVGVRVVMDRKNAYYANVNKAVNLLQQELKKDGNRRRPVELRSGLRKCKASCRGKTGFAHSKFFVFSKSGKARQVVINSSANATDLSASNQWNDAYTMIGDTAMYDAFAGVFDQMYTDVPVTPTYLTADSGTRHVEFYPYNGPGLLERDPVLQELDKVACRGATNSEGGRTRIQISMTSWFGERGIDIAQKIRDLKTEGCTIKIVYAVAGGEVVRTLRRAGIPIRHIVQDFDRDGVYDRYLHQKVMTVRGVYDGDPGSWTTFNGSANWSPLSLVSDEANLRIQGEVVLRKYNRYIDELFRNPPPNRTSRGRSADRAVSPDGFGPTTGEVRPGEGAYAKVQHD